MFKLTVRRSAQKKTFECDNIAAYSSVWSLSLQEDYSLSLWPNSQQDVKTNSLILFLSFTKYTKILQAEKATKQPSYLSIEASQMIYE